MTQDEMQGMEPEIRLYQIRDWSKHYENDRTRGLRYPLAWCAFPTKLAGLGRSRILRHRSGRGEGILGCFVQIVLVAAYKWPPRDGWLTEDGTPAGLPLSAGDLAAVTGYSLETVTLTLAVCAAPPEPGAGRVDWIIDHGVWQKAAISRTKRASTGDQRERTPAALTDPAQGKEGRKEGRKEGEGDARGAGSDPPPSSSTSGSGKGPGTAPKPKSVLDLKSQIQAVEDHLKRLQSSDDLAAKNAAEIKRIRARREILRRQLIDA